MEQLEIYITKIDNIVQDTIKEDKLLSNILKFKLHKLHSIIAKIRPVSRIKRWESLGKVWKYVSGSPDAEDLKVINFTMNSLIDQNDKQIRINDAIEHRLNNITQKLNSLLKFETNLTTDMIDGFNSVNLVFTLDELIYQLEVIEEAITLARKNIPSSRIINTVELNVAKEFLSSSGLGQDIIGNVLDIASVYVIYSKEKIIYTLKIPRIKDTAYKLNFIEPIVSNNLRIQLNAKFYLEGPKPFLSKTPCSKSKNLFICSSSQIEPVTECIQQLITDQPANCTMERTYGKNIINRIDDANIVLNDADLSLSSNCSTQERKLQGSFLIQFHHCTLRLNGEEYTNNNYEAQPQSFVPTTGLKVNPTKFINRLPLELLQEQHLEHRSHLVHLNLTTDNIHWKLNLFGWLSFGTLSTMTIIIISVTAIGVLKIFFWKRRGQEAPSTTLELRIAEPEETKEPQRQVTFQRQPHLIPQE